jgi:hypothetical protein
MGSVPPVPAPAPAPSPSPSSSTPISPIATVGRGTIKIIQGDITSLKVQRNIVVHTKTLFFVLSKLG